jgi:hypothetical protein
MFKNAISKVVSGVFIGFVRRIILLHEMTLASHILGGYIDLGLCIEERSRLALVQLVQPFPLQLL